MTSVGGEGSSRRGGRQITEDSSGKKVKTLHGEASNEPKTSSPPINGSKPKGFDVPQGFGMGSGNREGLRLSLENNIGGIGSGSVSSSSLMLTTPTMTSSNVSPGSLSQFIGRTPTLLTPGTLNLLNTPTSSSVLGLVASSPAGAPTLTTPTLTPTTLRNIEQMFLEHDELGGFGGSHSSESHENAAHFVPPPVAADDLSRSVKEERAPSHKEEKHITSTRKSITSCTSPEVDSQTIDAAEVLNSIAQLTPIPTGINHIKIPMPTTLARPSTLLPSNLSIGPISLTQVPPPLTVLKPNGVQDHLGKPTEQLLPDDQRLKEKEEAPADTRPILTVPSMSTASSLTVTTVASSDNQGLPLPLIRVPPALPTITISLPPTSQLVKQELLPSEMEKNSSFLPPNTNSPVLLPSIPLPQAKDLSIKPMASLRPTTLNIPKPLAIPTILMPKESLASTNSSLLSLANVSAVQNHLPVLPPPTRHHLQGVGSVNSNNIANHVPSNLSTPMTTTNAMITTLNKTNNANNCAMGPLAVMSGLPPGLTITANTIIKQEIPNNDDIINNQENNVIQNASNYHHHHTSSSTNINGNQQQPPQTTTMRQHKRKPGKTKPFASQQHDASEIKNGPNNRNNNRKNSTATSEQDLEDMDENDSSTSSSNNLDLSGLTNEEKRKMLRRQRNKEAAARCRKRRLDQTMGLQEQVDGWIDNRNELQQEINELQNQETELQNILSLHQLTTNCRLKDTTRKLLLKNSIDVATVLEREVAPISGGLGRLAAVAAAVSNSMKMAKEVEQESSINLSTRVEDRPMKQGSSTTSTSTNNPRKDHL